LEPFFIGAKALKPELAEPGTNQGPSMKEAVGVKLWPKRHERRFGDDRLIEVKKSCTHHSMLGPCEKILRGGYPMKAIVQSCAESVRAINTT
jgi:hypothetical protein